MAHKFLVHHIGDSIGVAIQDIEPRQEVEGVYLEDDSTISIQVKDFIPLGQKVALADIYEDEGVIEYREKIGVATQTIEKGKYVHIHNLKTARW